MNQTARNLLHAVRAYMRTMSISDILVEGFRSVSQSTNCLRSVPGIIRALVLRALPYLLGYWGKLAECYTRRAYPGMGIRSIFVPPVAQVTHSHLPAQMVDTWYSICCIYTLR